MSSLEDNYLDEAKRLVEIINPTLIRKQEDWLFYESMKARVRVNGFVGKKQIFWLRDIKDRQLEA